jgi:hypothetical protein
MVIATDASVTILRSCFVTAISMSAIYSGGEKNRRRKNKMEVAD